MKLRKFIATTMDGYLNEQKESLLAPNGNVSNLSKDLYEYVRSEEFKNWFGDWENNPNDASKIIDENGEPMLVFHGTNNEFNEFKNAYHKNRYFFTNDEELSKSYGSRNLKVFLNIKNPFKTNNNIEFTNTFDDSEMDIKYDGVVYNSETEKGEPINAIISFNPNQIKIIS